jgi:hypothetical protein
MKKNDRTSESSGTFNTRWLCHGAALLQSLVLAIIFFLPFIRAQRSFIWDTRDFGFPYLNLVTRTIAEKGVLPLWNQFNFSGYPFAGDIETGMFYPVNWLFAGIFGAMQFFELPWYFVFHFAFGAFFAYLLCHRLTKIFFASLCGAVIFTYSGYALGHISHMGQDIMYMWIPAVVLAFYHALETRKIFTALLAGFTLGVAMLAGHANTMVYLFYLVAALIATYTLVHRAHWKKILLTGAAGIIFSMLIAAILLLPVAELTLQSNRLNLTYENQSKNFSLNPADLGGIIWPNYNNVLEANPPTGFTGSVDISQNYLYFGLLPLILIAFSFFGKDWRPWFFGIMGMLALLLSFGHYTPLNKIFFDFMPGFNKVRMAVQILAIFFFAASVLSALGMARLFTWLKVERNRPLQVFIGLLFLVIIVFDIFSNAYNKSFYSHPVDPHTVYDSQEENRSMGELTPAADELFRIHDETGEITPNKWMYYGIENVWGSGGIKLKQYDQLFKYVDRTQRTALTYDLLDFLNVKYLISAQKLDPQHFRKIKGAINSALNEKGELYENIRILPRAYFVTDFIVEPDAQKQFHLLQQGQIDYRTQVILAKQPTYIGQPEPTAAPTAPPASAIAAPTASSITIQQHDNQKFLLKAMTPVDAILVLSEVDAPGWQLTINGQPAEYLTANTVFRAVALKAGDYRLEFNYQPVSIQCGAIISIISLLLFVGFAIKAGFFTKKVAAK